MLQYPWHIAIRIIKKNKNLYKVEGNISIHQILSNLSKVMFLFLKEEEEGNKDNNKFFDKEDECVDQQSNPSKYFALISTLG